jgi:hypothetical protein
MTSPLILKITEVTLISPLILKITEVTLTSPLIFTEKYLKYDISSNTENNRSDFGISTNLNGKDPTTGTSWFSGANFKPDIFRPRLKGINWWLNPLLSQ